jgi:hypothetical protein
MRLEVTLEETQNIDDIYNEVMQWIPLRKPTMVAQ